MYMYMYITCNVSLWQGIYMSTAELSMLSSSGTDYIQDLDVELSTLKVEVRAHVYMYTACKYRCIT